MARKVIVPVSMDSDADRDLLQWLDQQENRSGAVREALRAYIGRGDVTLGDVYQAVRDLERKLQTGAVVSRTPDDCDSGNEWQEPPGVAEALDALADL
jgi:hypothetical protein